MGSKKHNTKHPSRGVSNYPLRLMARGLSSAQVRMPFIDRFGKAHDTMDGVLKRQPRDEEF